MTPKKRKLMKVAIYLSFIFLVLAAVYFISPQSGNNNSDSSSIFPKELGDMNLVEEYSGERAKSEIRNMHLGEWDFLKGYAGYYEGNSGESATFWTAIFHNQSQAINTTEWMTNEINKGDTPFSVPEKITLNQTDVDHAYYVEGIGQDHYYWQKDDIVVWMALTNINLEKQNQLLDSAMETIG